MAMFKSSDYGRSINNIKCYLVAAHNLQSLKVIPDLSRNEFMYLKQLLKNVSTPCYNNSIITVTQ